MAILQDLKPGEQNDIWGDIVESNLVAVNTELISTTAKLDGIVANGGTGKDGLSPYEYAVAKQGFIGTYAEWEETIRGPKGDTGVGVQGEPGPQGLSAHQVAVARGANADVDAWLSTLVGPQGVGGTQVLVDGTYQTEVRLSSAPITAADVGAASIERIASLEALVAQLAEKVANAPGVGPSAQTWTAVLDLAATSPVIMPERGAGRNIAMEWAMSSLDLLMSIGLTTRMVLDGGDFRLTSDAALVNLRDSTVDRTMNGTGAISGLTRDQFKALFLKDFPLSRGTVSAERGTDANEWLDRIKTIGRWAWVEDKVMTAGVTGSTQKIIDLLTAKEMKTRSMYAGEASTATEANARLGPAKTAGIPVGLLQDATNNIGFPAILTAINGGKPDLVQSSHMSAPGNDDAWVQAAINANIAVALGPINRRQNLSIQVNRLNTLGGRLTLAHSNDPLYLARGVAPRLTDRFATQQSEYGLLPSDQTIDPPRIEGGALVMDSASVQYMLMGAFAQENAWAQLDIDLKFITLDTNTSRWGQVYFSIVDDGNLHDGTVDHPRLSCLLRQTGEMIMTNRVSSTSSSTVVSNSSTHTLLPGASRSGTTLTPVTAGQTVRLRIQNFKDAAGAFTEQTRVTRLDTGDWVQTAVGSAPVRGPYWHLGKNGTSGGKVAWSNIVVTK